ncbi:RDD family protein [Demequina litorisediminis]|uniref:RDD domain-containing protein n=1 Tax=Demequina litorisediminis TaxID=1849022 RepID=A0ABQ6IFR8_9MICO|nr:RDD family protein [Demequina litorisediminis]GMA36744.1 hypothetical protein GCM10025876_29480 [Demequina litorisediminis]
MELASVEGSPARIVPQLSTAPWIVRVLAVIIDSLVINTLVGAVTGQWGNALWITGVGDSSGESLTTPATWWYLGASLAMLTVQAFTGYTAGKALLGIRLVSDSSGRPPGFVLTLVREFLHLIDSLLLIGYLRPLWHRERRTFADSLARTLVIREAVGRGR